MQQQCLHFVVRVRIILGIILSPGGNLLFASVGRDSGFAQFSRFQRCMPRSDKAEQGQLALMCDMVAFAGVFHFRGASQHAYGVGHFFALSLSEPPGLWYKRHMLCDNHE